MNEGTRKSGKNWGKLRTACSAYYTLHTLPDGARRLFDTRKFDSKIIFHHRKRECSFHFRRRTVTKGKWESPNWRWFTLLWIRKVRKVRENHRVPCAAERAQLSESSSMSIVTVRGYSLQYRIRRSTITHYADYSGYFKQSVGSCACKEKTLYKRNTKIQT